MTIKRNLLRRNNETRRIKEWLKIQVQLELFRGTRALPLAAVGGVVRLGLNFDGVNGEELRNPIAHDVMLFEAAVLASVHLHHAAVINLGTNYAGHLQHLQEMGGELEAAALSSLRAVGADFTKVVRSHGEQRFDAGVFDVEW